MFKRTSILTAILLFGALPTAQAGVSSFPGLGEPTYSQAELNAAFNLGKATGRVEVGAECIADPSECGCADGLNPCGITASSTLSGAQFGETEPNNHMVAADPLITEVIYWGQTPWIQNQFSASSNQLNAWTQDQDWYYITTIEPNQRLDLVFTVPDRVLVDTTRMAQGWLVSVRDAAGNVYAQFDTRFALDDPTTVNKNESKEITYPLFLGHVGTYYISVQPQIIDNAGNLVTDPSQLPSNQLDLLSVMYSPYNIAAFLSFSGLDNAPPDVNFHDVEVEPNNSNATANALTTGVTMFGLLRQVNDGTIIGYVPAGDEANGQPVFLQTDKDIFKYTATGPEQIRFTMCGQEACEADTFWFIEVTKADGTPLISFNTDKAETVNFGLPSAGTYYIEINFQRTVDAYCATYSETEFECKQESTNCQVLTATAVPPVVDDPDTPADETAPGRADCTYGDGNICESSAASTATVSCVRTDLTPVIDPTTPPAATDNPVWRWLTVCDDYSPVCTSYGILNASDPDTNEPYGLNVQYNFTWWATRLYPLTNGTPAFDSFLERPSFYNDR